MSDVIIKYNHTFHGRQTFFPDWSIAETVGKIWDPEQGQRTLEFDLTDDQKVEVVLPTAKMRILISRNGFEVKPLPQEEQCLS